MAFKIRRWVGIFVLCAVVMSLPALAAADRFTDQVKLQLAQAAVILGVGNDFTLTHDPVVDSVRRGGTDSFTLTLRPGKSYAIVGVCDQDCRDIDLRLYDENDNLIDSDMEVEDHPLITVSPRWTAKFRIEVIMSGCSVSSCYYGIGVFGK